MTAKVILNPYAGRWMALKRRPELEHALQTAGVKYELSISEYPNHAEKLALQAANQGFSPIIAAGGDGTISEVVNGIAQSNEGISSVPLGLMPLGTANDLVYNLGLSNELVFAGKIIITGATHPVDVCQVNGRLFVNNAAIGLEPTITVIQSHITRLRGIIRYLYATFLGIMSNPQWYMRLDWEGNKHEGLVTLVTVGNNPRTGGLFFMAPHANPYDHLLTFVYGHIPTRLGILKTLPRTMKAGVGNYVEHPAVHEFNSSWLKVSTDKPTPLHADGELQSSAIQEIEFSMYPERVNIILPS